MLVKAMATDRTIAQLRTVVRSLRCDPRTFLTIVLRTHEQVAPQERQLLRPFFFFISYFLLIPNGSYTMSGFIRSR
jgi:hypothetical protein